ncbi:MAG: TonB-dependent receptor, partial [Nevskiales bacterium]
RYDFDWFTLVSETSRAKKLSDANFDGSFVAEAAATRGVYSLRERISADTDAITQELRLVSPPSDSPWAWLAGAYLGRYDARFTFNESVANTEILGQLLTTLGLPLPDPLNLTVTPEGLSVLYLRVDPLEAKEEALFGELTRKFFDNRLEFGLGGRFYQQQLTTQGVEGGVLGPATIVLGVLGTVRGTDGGFPPKERGFSPKGSVKFQWTRDLLLYGAIARGFQYGGRNGQALIPTDNVYPLTYKSSSVWSYEAGVRTDWLDKTLQLDLTGFYIDWTDIQILQKTASGNTDYTSNAGKARSVGVEGAVRWVTPIPGLSLSNVASYIRATIQETYTTAEGFVIAKGDDLASAPHLQTATTLGYKLPLGSFSAGAGLTYAHIGEAFNNITHDFTIFDYGTLDASITLGAPQWQFAPELTFSGTNLTDERVLTGGRISGNNNPALQGALEINRVTYNRPRAFAARLSFRF